MLRLDENLRTDVQTSAQRQAEYELDVPTDGNCVQHYPTEGFCLGEDAPETHDGQIGRYMVEGNDMSDVIAEGNAVADSASTIGRILSGRLEHGKFKASFTNHDFSTGC